MFEPFATILEMGKKKSLVIVGTGDASCLAEFYFSQGDGYNVVAFTVDESYLTEKTFLNRPVLGFTEFLNQFPPNICDVFVAIGYSQMNKARAEKFAVLKSEGYHLPSYISPHAICLTESIGDNCFILEGAIVQPMAIIGNNVTIWSGATVSHHSAIGDHTFIGPRAAISGHVTVGQRSFIGINATIKDHIVLGDETLVAAGALVVKETPFQAVCMSEASKIGLKNSSEIKKI